MAATEDLIGSVVDGKYEIVRLIGRGGMGEVYEARHQQLERRVAIKVLHGEFVGDEVAMARFTREARATARIEHPNAVSIYDFGKFGSGSAYIVMEYVEGVSLRQMLRQGGILTLEGAVDLVRQAAGATAAAHAQGIIHRDLKPENMIVRVDDEDRPLLKVVDFGLAKMLTTDSVTQLTAAPDLMGTPKYMAPELVSGEEVDERVDVYALGVIFYELAAGRAPFEGSFTEIMAKQLYADPPPLESFGVQVPEALEAVIRRALEKAPAARTRSAGDFLRELEAALSGDEPVGSVALPAPTGAPEDFHTRYERNEDEETRVRSRREALAGPLPAAPERAAARLTMPLSEPLTARAPQSGGRRMVLAILGFAVFIGAGTIAMRALRKPVPVPVAPAPAAPAAPKPAPEPEPPTAGAPVVTAPFYKNGKIGFPARGSKVRPGAVVEVTGEGGRRETFPLTMNEKKTKWVVDRSARSQPGGLSVDQVIGTGNRIVELSVRNADGTASPRTMFSLEEGE